jgi:hypothetical protein
VFTPKRWLRGGGEGGDLARSGTVGECVQQKTGLWSGHATKKSEVCTTHNLSAALYITWCCCCCCSGNGLISGDKGGTGYDMGAGGDN